MFVRFVFVSPFCACLFAKAEISWLGTIRGDSECKAELFLFVSDISALGDTSVCACVSVCFMCSCTPQMSASKKRKMSDVCVLIPAYQSTCGRAHWETELSISLHVGLKAVRSDPTPQPAIQPAATFVL